MHSLSVDTALQKSLAGADALTEIVDSQGNILGYFSPAKQQSAAVYAEAAAHFDPAEMERRKQSGEQGLTTDEVLARLEASGS